MIGEELPETTLESLRAPAIDRGNLSRVDWRVLLPVPADGFEHMVLLGGPEGLSHIIVELGLARRVSRELPAEPSADVVAILRDARTGCEEAAESLVPGGTLYWEVEYAHRRWASPEAQIRRRLRRSGLVPTGFYWARPNFERCEFFIPVEVPSAVRWYLTNFSVHRTLAFRWGATAAAGAIGWFVRRCAVTAIAGSPEDGCPSILSHPAVPPGFRQREARPLVINRQSADASRRVAVFPFRKDSNDPVAVLKFWRLAGRNDHVVNEQRVAAEIRSRLDPAMQRSIPAPLGTSRWGQLVVGGESCALGKPMAQDSSRAEARRLQVLRLVTRWLLEFHRESRAGEPFLSDSESQNWLQHMLADYGAAFGNTADEEDLFERVRRRARSLSGCKLPLVWTHPAFSERNICRARDQITVIDWEGVALGPPLRDLIYFVTLWYRSSKEFERPTHPDSFRKLFFGAPDDPLAQFALASLEKYMQSLSVDPRFFPVMLVATWVGRSLSRYRRVGAPGGPRLENRRGNLHIERLGILAENRHRLFPEQKEDS